MIDGPRLPTIEAPRVSLRWLDDRDVDALFAIFSSAEVTRYWSSPPQKDRSEAERLLETIREHFGSKTLFQWGLVRRDDDRVIGTCTLASVDAANLRAELGFALGREHWGHGYMREALGALCDYTFGTLGLRRLEADVDPDNAASIRLLQTLGFSREGLLRERWRVGGGVQDTLFFGLLSGEWRRERPPAAGTTHLGIDVQIRRGCSYYALDDAGRHLRSGWARGGTNDEIASALFDVVRDLEAKHARPIAVGIDAPRAALRAPRPFYWSGAKGAWRRRSPGDKGHGRHCEVAVKALGLGNPQWTRDAQDSPEWMRLGYRLFEQLGRERTVVEVFPSAAYRMLANDGSAEVPFNLAECGGGPKDMLDACVAAFTVREFLLGRGAQVGGGDGLGSIVVPRPVADSPVLTWPGT